MKKNGCRWEYNIGKIVSKWRELKGAKGYAQTIAKEFGIPLTVVHNVIYRHRKSKKMSDMKYRSKKNGKPLPKETSKVVPIGNYWYLRNQVAFAGANIDARNLTII